MKERMSRRLPWPQIGQKREEEIRLIGAGGRGEVGWWDGGDGQFKHIRE